MDTTTLITILGIVGTGIVTLGTYLWKASKQNAKINHNAEHIEELRQSWKSIKKDQVHITEELEAKNDEQNSDINQIKTDIAVIKTNQELYMGQMMHLVSKQDIRINSMETFIARLDKLTVRLEERILPFTDNALKKTKFTKDDDE